MKIFDKDGKINFVDVNNVFVGYEDGQQYCEDADWYIMDEFQDNIISDVSDREKYQLESDSYDGFVFDVDWFEEISMGVVFRLFIPNVKGCKYLYLMNEHNGYYDHGFTFSVNGNVINEGSI